MLFSKRFDHGGWMHNKKMACRTQPRITLQTQFFLFTTEAYLFANSVQIFQISMIFMHWVSVVRGFDHTLWFHKFWTFSWKMSLKICKDVCECICRGQGRRNKKLLVNNLWGLLRSYAIMQMVRRRRICVVIEFEGVSTKK